MTEKKSYEKENRDKYGLEGNTAKLTFEGGAMVSRGSLNNVTIKVDLRFCKGCGICTEECPTGALQLQSERGKLQQSFKASLSRSSNGDSLLFDPEKPKTWQELPHHAGLIVATDEDSYNETGAWRIGEVVIGDADKCVVCGLCYQHCPEDIISVVPSDSEKPGRSNG